MIPTSDDPAAVRYVDQSSAWTKDISHGELVRSTNGQTMTIDPCKLKLLYQGRDPQSGSECSQLPYRLGLATRTDSTY
ncbi:non-reducing end alpha-L-arabinofuranosidase family hydrolase [Streptomyces sp. NPDC029674]|uniref:non-reducing end alpha-L-arabinofuranosidase family hydrolase n=1 Tax=Streptomyces sp. NPDC029674 TaxID=3365297 RepID=UPI00384EBB17